MVVCHRASSDSVIVPPSPDRRVVDQDIETPEAVEGFVDQLPASLDRGEIRSDPLAPGESRNGVVDSGP